jgi:hypothetical protein
MTQEIYKSIPGYEGYYEVSNLGNVKSLPRKIYNGTGFFISKEKLLKPLKDIYGYFYVSLCKDNNVKNYTIHKAVAITFLGHVPCGMKLVVDHINDIKTDNRVENLQIITNRENSYKTQLGYSSNYKGVCLHKKRNRWVARIIINKKKIHLGYYTDEYQAHLAYQKALHTHLKNDKPI